jgi:hypothetical protein
LKLTDFSTSSLQFSPPELENRVFDFNHDDSNISLCFYKSFLRLNFGSDHLHETVKGNQLIKSLCPDLIFPGSDILVNSFLLIDLKP